MQIYFHSRLCSYLSRVPILVEGTVQYLKNVIYCCYSKAEFSASLPQSLVAHDPSVKLNLLDNKQYKQD